jgi:hypothetical protein
MRNYAVSDPKRTALDLVIDAMLPGARPLGQQALEQIAMSLIAAERPRRPRGRPQSEGLRWAIVFSLLTCRRARPAFKVEALYVSVARAWGTTPGNVKKIMTARAFAPMRRRVVAQIDEYGIDQAKVIVVAALQAYRKAVGTEKR